MWLGAVARAERLGPWQDSPFLSSWGGVVCAGADLELLALMRESGCPVEEGVRKLADQAGLRVFELVLSRAPLYPHSPYWLFHLADAECWTDGELGRALAIQCGARTSLSSLLHHAYRCHGFDAVRLAGLALGFGHRLETPIDAWAWAQLLADWGIDHGEIAESLAVFGAPSPAPSRHPIAQRLCRQGRVRPCRDALPKVSWA